MSPDWASCRSRRLIFTVKKHIENMIIVNVCQLSVAYQYICSKLIEHDYIVQIIQFNRLSEMTPNVADMISTMMPEMPWIITAQWFGKQSRHGDLARLDQLQGPISVLHSWKLSLLGNQREKKTHQVKWVKSKPPCPPQLGLHAVVFHGAFFRWKNPAVQRLHQAVAHQFGSCWLLTCWCFSWFTLW